MMARFWMLVVFLMPVNAFAQIFVTPVDGIHISMSSQVSPIPLNQMHGWVITLFNHAEEPIENATIQVEGGMPQHNHGLATSPQVTGYLGDGQYLLEGLRFHMPGDWLMTIQIEHQGRTFRTEARFRLGAELIQPFRNNPR